MHSSEAPQVKKPLVEAAMTRAVRQVKSGPSRVSLLWSRPARGHRVLLVRAHTAGDAFT